MKPSARFTVLYLAGLALLSLGFGTACFADVATDYPISENDYLADLPIIATATRLPQSAIEAPVSITVIDRELIQTSGAVEIADLFRLVPGMQVGKSWRDHHAAVTYHGQSDGLSRRMQVLLDGRVAFGSHFGITDWDRLGITVDDIERIEVARGPSGASYGSNAFIATINIVTQQGLSALGKHLSYTAGPENFKRTNLRYGAGGDNYDYKINLDYFETTGFRGVNDEVNVGALRLQGRYDLSTRNIVDYQFAYASGPAGRGGQLPPADPIADKNVQEIGTAIRWTRPNESNEETYLQLSYNRSREKDEYVVGMLAELLGVTPQELPDLYPGLEDTTLIGGTYNQVAERFDLEWQQTNLPQPALRVAWGFGLRQDRDKGWLTLRDPGWHQDFNSRLFGNLEKSLDSFLVNLGVLWEDGDLASDNLSYRSGINYSMSPDQMVRLSYAVGYRHAFTSEAYFDLGARGQTGEYLSHIATVDGIPNPEKITSWELGYIGFWNDSRVKTELKLFREFYSNEIREYYDPAYPEIISVFNPGSIVRTNLGETTIRGIESNLDWHLTKDLRLWLSYGYADANQVDENPLALRNATAHPGTPRHTLAGVVSYHMADNWQIGASYYYLDEMGWFVWGDDLDSYQRVDLLLSWTKRVGSTTLKLELIGQSLNGSYREFSHLNQFDRRGYIRLSVNF